MTDRAIRREARSRVIRCRRTVVILGVAGITISGRPGIFAPNVALNTRQRGMKSRQRKFGIRRMIKRNLGPVHRRMTDSAGPRERRLDMVRIRCPVKRCRVAGIAIGRQGCVIVGHMARRTRHRCVRPGQRKRPDQMIEAGRHPGNRRMTHRAIRRESASYVRRLGRPVEGREVAPVAVLG